MRWFAQEPTNIALIKYMGKEDEDQNLPANASLSYTLNDLYTFVELEKHGGDEDYWEPLEMPGGHPEQISDEAQARFLKHLHFIKDYFKSDQGFTVRSCNNFPFSVGLASSASSFAALTMCAVRALTELTNHDDIGTDAIAELSRHGSGSSCRSFYKPWTLWDRDGTRAIDTPYDDLIHHAVIVTHDVKEVSSSEAHRRVKTSPNYNKRLENVAIRLDEMTKALQRKDWRTTYELAWEEFHEMHDLFKTSDPKFGYMNDDTHKILREVKDYWRKNTDGPIVTVDAGPNVHLLFRADQDDMAEVLKEKFLKDYDVI